MKNSAQFNVDATKYQMRHATMIMMGDQEKVSVQLVAACCNTHHSVNLGYNQSSLVGGGWGRAKARTFPNTTALIHSFRGQ
jgi:hypothetical protein